MGAMASSGSGTIRPRAALHIWWPDFNLNIRPKSALRNPDSFKSPGDQAKERLKKLKAIDRFFDEAEAYAKARAAQSKFQKVPAWEATLEATSGKQQIIVHANYERQIRSAVAWGKRRGYRIIIAAGLDAWRVADLLVKEKVPVVLDSTFRLPQRDTDPHDVNFRAAGVLHKAGVPVAHSVKMGSWGASEIRNVVYAAARSMSAARSGAAKYHFAVGKDAGRGRSAWLVNAGERGDVYCRGWRLV